MPKRRKPCPPPLWPGLETLTPAQLERASIYDAILACLDGKPDERDRVARLRQRVAFWSPQHLDLFRGFDPDA